MLFRIAFGSHTDINKVPPVSLAETAFDAEGFLKEGLEKVVSGMGVTTIPGFRSGTQVNHMMQIS